MRGTHSLDVWSGKGFNILEDLGKLTVLEQHVVVLVVLNLRNLVLAHISTLPKRYVTHHYLQKKPPVSAGNWSNEAGE